MWTAVGTLQDTEQQGISGQERPVDLLSAQIQAAVCKSYSDKDLNI